VNLDTGKPTAPGSYPLADQTYARYLALLVKPRKPSPPPTPLPAPPGTQPQQAATDQPAAKAQPAPAPTLQPIDPAIRADIVHYFSNSQRRGGILQLKKDQWKHLAQQLVTLRQLPAAKPASQTNSTSS
jgi:hypothetical protein